MSTKVERFLNQLAVHLNKMPEVERNDVIKEMKSHILESLKRGKSEKEILEQLGDPKQLSKAYLSEHVIQKQPSQGLLQKFAFLMSINLLSSVITLLLGVLSSIVSLVAGVLFFTAITSASVTGLNYFKLLDKPIGYYFELFHLPAISEVPVALLFSVIFGFISFVLVKLIHKYFDAVTTKYRNSIPTK